MPRRRVPELVQEITVELRKGLIFEAPIVGGKEHIEGLCSWDTQEITVNPDQIVSMESTPDTIINTASQRTDSARPMARP